MIKLNKHFKQKHLFSLVFLFSFLMPSSLVNNFYVVWNVDGVVQFASDYPNSNLHFTMFGDGYYQHSKYPLHHYETDVDGYEAVYFTVGDKRVEEPEAKGIKTGTITSPSTPSNPPLKMNKILDLKLAWNITTYAETYLMVHYENIDDEKMTEGCILVNYDPSQMWVNENFNPLGSNGSGGSLGANAKSRYTGILIEEGWGENLTHDPQSGLITWEFSNLQFGEQRVVYIPMKGFMTEDSGTVDISAFMLDPNCNDPAIANINSTFDVLGHPHDPNYKKSVNLSYLSHSQALEDDYEIHEQEIIYEVQFHNIGTAPAKNVTVIDILPPEIDPLSIELLSSDHPCDHVGATFYFHNIWLPGLGQGYDFEETISKFRFKACVTEFIDPEVCITNNIEIIFDNQPPVPATHTICSKTFFDGYHHYANPCSGGKEKRLAQEEVQQTIEKGPVTIYPNPVGDVLNLKNADYKNITALKIVNASGIEMQSHGKLIYNSINIKNLPKGLYYLLIESHDGPITSKFVKN